MEDHQISRAFPSEITNILPIRQSLLDYKKTGGRVLTSAESPECDGDDVHSGFMCSVAMCPPIVGHASVMNGELSVCEIMYADLTKRAMIETVSKFPVTELRWIVESYDGFHVALPEVPRTELMARASMPYSVDTPLSVYNRHAAIEAADFSNDSGFWQILYAPLEKVSCYYGMYGIIHDNTTMSLGAAAGDEVEPNTENRKPKADQLGFIDACFTPQSKSAGKVRSFVMGTSIRIMTERTIQLAHQVLTGLKEAFIGEVEDWVVRCAGFCCMATAQDVHRMMNIWMHMSEPNMPTFHIFAKAKVVVISIATGVVIRPVRVGIAGNKIKAMGPYVDTMMVYHSDSLAMMGIEFPDVEQEPEQYFNAAVRTIPFGAWTAEPRLNLGVQMLRQSMSMMPIRGDATMMATGMGRQLVTTPVSDMITSYSSSSCILSLPGKSVMTAFVNRYYNSEDACSVSKSWAKIGKFSWTGYINYPLPSGVQSMPPGTVLKDQPWWKPAIEGIVMDMRMSKTGSHYIVVHVIATSLEIGDKIATAHGLKLTIGELIDDNDMPEIIDETIGKKFKPNILLSTKSVGRGIGGQIREMAAATAMFSSVYSFRCADPPSRHSTFTFDDQKLVTPVLPSGPLIVNGKPMFMTDKSGVRRQVKASYGIMSVLHLRHMAKLKQHYASVNFNGVTIPKGRMRQGTPRLGEGELSSMMMQNMMASVRDSVMTSDLCYVPICPACSRLVTNCDCPQDGKRPDAVQVLVRYSTVLLDVYTTISSLASRSKPVMALTYRSET